MIIDEILDFKENKEYGYNFDLDYIYAEAKIFDFDYITKAIENGNNTDLQNALCKYIDKNDYNPQIKDFIKSQKFMDKQKKQNYYFVPNDSYGQHGCDIWTLNITPIEYNYIDENREYNGVRGFITDSYAGACYYVND